MSTDKYKEDDIDMKSIDKIKNKHTRYCIDRLYSMVKEIKSGNKYIHDEIISCLEGIIYEINSPDFIEEKIKEKKKEQESKDKNDKIFQDFINDPHAFIRNNRYSRETYDNLRYNTKYITNPVELEYCEEKLDDWKYYSNNNDDDDSSESEKDE